MTGKSDFTDSEWELVQRGAGCRRHLCGDGLERRLVPGELGAGEGIRRGETAARRE